MPVIRAKDLDRLIRIERVTYTTNSINEQVPSWATFVECWAAKHDLSSREYAVANQAGVATIEVVFRTWWIDGVLPSMRIFLQGVYYNITGFAELGRREGIEMRTTRVV